MLMSFGLLIPSLQLFSPFIGLVVDRYGPKITAYVQGCCFTVGFLIVIAGASTLIDQLLYLGFSVIALNVWMGSQLILQLGLYFSGHTISRVITILNGMKDGGAITYLLLWWINKKTGSKLSWTLGVYTGTGAILFAVSFYFWSAAVPVLSSSDSDDRPSDSGSLPSSRFSRYEDLVSTRTLDEALQNNLSTRLSQHLAESSRSLTLSRHSHVTPFESKKPKQQDSNKTLETTSSSVFAEGDQKYVVVAKRNPVEQLKSTPYVVLCVFFSIQVGIANWNTSTQKDFLLDLGDDDHTYLFIFTLLTPLSVIGAMFVDYMILSFGWNLSLQSINVLAVSFLSVKIVSTDLNVQIIGFVLFAFYRSFLFGISFSFLASLVSGPVVGRAGGIMTASAGAISLLMIPLIHLVVRHDTVDFFVPNVIVLALCAPTAVAICILAKFIRLERDHTITGEDDCPV